MRKAGSHGVEVGGWYGVDLHYVLNLSQPAARGKFFLSPFIFSIMTFLNYKSPTCLL